MESVKVGALLQCLSLSRDKVMSLHNVYFNCPFEMASLEILDCYIKESALLKDSKISLSFLRTTSTTASH